MTGARDKSDWTKEWSDDDQDWWLPLDRPSAVELLQSALLRYVSWRSPITDDPMFSVRLPIEVWRIILDCALKGMHKGEGRHRPPLTHGDKVRREAIYAFAGKRAREEKELLAKRQKELLAKRQIAAEGEITTTEECEQKAAKEAQDLAQERYNWKVSISTIRKWM
jgi:hypothetical protein